MLKRGNWKALVVACVLMVGVAWGTTKMRSLIITASIIDSTTIGATTPSTGAFTTLTWNAVQTNCLSAICAGGSTYSTTGGSYTNNSSTPVIEEVTYSTLGASECTGANSYITATVSGSIVGSAGVFNECQGTNSISFVVPVGATFSVAYSTFGTPPSTWTLSGWAEVSL